MDIDTKQRTIVQNKAIHKYFELLADALNDAGLDMKEVLKPEIDIPWTKQSVKDHLWRPIQKAMYSKESTKELDTKNPSQVYETLNRHLGQKLSIHVPFPSMEEQMLEDLDKEERYKRY